MATQFISASAVLQVGVTVIAHLKDVTWGFRPRPVTEYDISGGDPALLEPDQIEYSVNASWGYASDVVRVAIKNTKVDIIVSSRGTGLGMPRHTLTGAILSWEERVERNRVIMVNISGTYISETIDTH